MIISLWKNWSKKNTHLVMVWFLPLPPGDLRWIRGWMSRRLWYRVGGRGPTLCNTHGIGARWFVRSSWKGLIHFFGIWKRSFKKYCILFISGNRNTCVSLWYLFGKPEHMWSLCFFFFETHQVNWRNEVDTWNILYTSVDSLNKNNLDVKA